MFGRVLVCVGPDASASLTRGAIEIERLTTRAQAPRVLRCPRLRETFTQCSNLDTPSPRPH